MKKLFSIFLIFISSCSTIVPTVQVIQTSHDINVVSKKNVTSVKNWKGEDSPSVLMYEWKSIVVEDYDDLKVGGVDADKAEAMSIKTGEKFHIGNWPWGFFVQNDFMLINTVIENCETLFDSECVITRTTSYGYIDGKHISPGVYYDDLDDYKKKTEQKRLQEIQKQKEEQVAYEKRKQDAFNKLYDTCISYGFSEQNAIATCIQQEVFNEKKLVALKEQELKQPSSINNQQTYQEKNFMDIILEELANPYFWENARQNAEIQRLKNQQRRTIPKICPGGYGTPCN